jgi:hypothetical protein
VKNIGLDHTLKTIEKPPYSSYAPKGAEVQPVARAPRRSL